jgi:nucleoside-diphosphate kinase
VSDALVILKPDSAHRLAARAGIWTWLSSQDGWKLESLTWFRPPAELIESHYDFLQDRPFFPWLVDFMTALPLVVGRVNASPDILERMRYDLGETRIAQSRPGSLRERFGISGGINCVHLSDAPDTGAAEVKRWSGYLDLDKVDVKLDKSSNKPDHTYHLRSLAAQVSAGVHVGLASQAMRELLAEETDLVGDDLQALYRITLGALT